MSFGVTNTGFVRKTNEKIVDDLKTAWKNEFGQDADLSNDSPNTILIGLVASMADVLWQTAENTYNSLDRNSATGTNLDNAVSLVGVTRAGASPSKANVSFRGTDATIIPLGTQVSQSSTNKVFKTTKESIISRGAANWIEVEITTVTPSVQYSFNIDANVYTHTSSGSPTATTIIAGIKSVLEGASLGLSVTDIGSNKFTVEETDKNDTSNISVDSKMTVNKSQSIIEVEALENGVLQVPASSINTISQSITGLDSVINYFEGQAGTGVESDQDLRLRTNKNIAVAGFSFKDAIRSRILNEVAGVSYCNVYENDTLVTDSDGVPAKSFEAVVEGGSDSDLAEKIFTLKVAGISTSGNTSKVVNDVMNTPNLVKFSRPANLYFWVKVVINSYNSEEVFPTNGVEQIKNSVLSFSNSNFNIGDVIVTQKFFNPVYAIPGVGACTITIASTDTPTDTPTYSANNINCTIRQRPNFNISRISVTI